MKGQKGFTLVELLVTLTIFIIIFGMMYSVYNAFIRMAATQRKTEKTEMDVVNVAWPMIKEIQSAGFGTPSSGTCTPAAAVAGSGAAQTLTIHSTNAGNNVNCGKWSYLDAACSINSDTFPNAANLPVVVINALDRSLVGTATVNSSGSLPPGSCTTAANQIAYWSPGGIGCYETAYSLQAYTSTNPRPGVCESGTSWLGRSHGTTSPIGTTNLTNLMDCVLGIAFRFGCIDTAGALTWQTGTNCGTGRLRLLKVGLVVQSSQRGDLPAADEDTAAAGTQLVLFKDLASGMRESITLTADQTNFRWKKFEQTITLRNIN